MTFKTQKLNLKKSTKYHFYPMTILVFVFTIPTYLLLKNTTKNNNNSVGQIQTGFCCKTTYEKLN